MKSSPFFTATPARRFSLAGPEREPAGPETGVLIMNRLIQVVGAGVIALAMSGGAWAASGAGVTPEQITAAKTAADHEAIAKAYEGEAAGLESKAEMHEQMGKAYRIGVKPAFIGQAKHCAALAKDFKAAAIETRALAAEHHKIAKDTGK